MKRQVWAVAMAAMAAVGLGSAALAEPAEPGVPEGARGFRGSVRGVVVDKGNGDAFAFKIGRIVQVFDRNEAQEPEALVGRTVRVRAGRIEADGGGTRPNELQAAFVRVLASGQELTLELGTDGAEGFTIMELTPEQRMLARGPEGQGRTPEPRDLRQPASHPAQDRRPEMLPMELRERELLIKVLRDELRQLYMENAELRRQLEQQRRGEPR